MKWAEALVVCLLKVGAVTVEELHHFDVAILAGDRQRCCASRVRRINVGSTLDEQLHTVEIIDPCRSDQQCVLFLVLVHWGSVIDQLAGKRIYRAVGI